MCIGRPHREGGSGYPLMLDDSRAEPPPQRMVRPFTDQVQVQLAQRRWKPIGVLCLPGPRRRLEPEPVAGQVWHVDTNLEQPGVVDAPHRHDPAGVCDGGVDGIGMKRAHDGRGAVGMGPEHGVRMRVRATDHAAHVRRAVLGAGRRAAHAAPRSRKRIGTSIQEGRCVSS